MNAVFDNVNRHDKKSVNEAVYAFVHTINEAVEPLFKRNVNEARRKGFKEKFSRNQTGLIMNVEKRKLSTKKR